jgi:hypothetical protein
MTVTVTIHKGRVRFTGDVSTLSFDDEVIGAPEDVKANWVKFIPDIAEKVDAALAEQQPADDLPIDPPADAAWVWRVQAKIALSRAKLLPQVEAAVAAIGGEVAIWYADALTWRRNDPNVAGVALLLNLTDEQIDDLFAAAKLVG